MRATIYQPQYFPRLHYVNRILDSDMFVILDNAQYVRSLIHEGETREKHRSFQSDTYIKTSDGTLMLTVAIKNEGRNPINETKIQHEHKWSSKHIGALQHAYAKAPYYKEYKDELAEIIARKHASLADLNIATIIWGIARLIGVTDPLHTVTLAKLNQYVKQKPSVRLKRIVQASKLNTKRPPGLQRGTEWTAAICKEIGATQYVHGGTAQNSYMDPKHYAAHNIALVRQQWSCEAYPQQHEKRHGFIPNLSIIDVLMNVSPRKARQLLATESSKQRVSSS